MSAALCEYSFKIALVMFTIGKVSASTTLTILNNQSHLECETMQTVLTCELQSPPAFLMQWLVDVKINKALTTITNTSGVNNVEFVVTTRCVFHPGAVKLSLESKKVNGSGGFTSFQVESSNTETVCSNTENAYCGGNKTSKPKLFFAISTDTDGGEMHQFKLRLIQTLENGTNYTITFESDEIGPLRLPNNNGTTSQSTYTTTSSSTTTTFLTSPSDNSRSNNSTNIIDSPTSVMNESFIYLIVGGGLLFVLLVSCITHAVYIRVKARKRSDKNIQHTDCSMETNLNSHKCGKLIFVSIIMYSYMCIHRVLLDINII